MSEDLNGASGKPRNAGNGAPEAGQAQPGRGMPGRAGRAHVPGGAPRNGWAGATARGARPGSRPSGGGRTQASKAARSARDSAELRPRQIKIGRKDQSGRPITWVYWSTRDYAIYQWSREVPRGGPLTALANLFSKTRPTRTEYAISPHFARADQRLKYALIHRDLSEIYGLQQGRLARRESINREIARAIMLALEGQCEIAQSILNHLRARLVSMRNIEGRTAYLGACMGSMLIVLIALIAVSLANGASETWLKSTIVPLLGPDLLLLKVIVCGALGAFLSVCMRIEQLEIPPDTPRKVNGISGVTRLVIGMAAGLVVYLAIGAGLVLSDGLSLAVPDGQQLSAKVAAGILLLAVVAGFSEVFVPNILRRMGGDNGTGTNGESARDPAQGGAAPGSAVGRTADTASATLPLDRRARRTRGGSGRTSGSRARDR